jgi:putative DNA primase/helicase
MSGSIAGSQIEAAIEKALSYIPANNYETWAKMGIAVKDGMGEAGFRVWDRWSRTAAHYSEARAKPAWRSFDCDGCITVHNLFDEARKYGFTLPEDDRPALPRHSPDAERNEDSAIEIKEDTEQAHATTVEGMWEAAQPARRDHPYLVKKGIAPHGLRMDSDGNLLVPLSIGGHLQSLQFITKDGTKRFFPYARKEGCHFWLGLTRDITLFCICEGYATGASLFEATGLSVAVAFDAGNLEPVARALRHDYPDANIVVCADNDINDKGTPNTGVLAAITAAESINGLIAVPEMNGQKCDFNDLHRQRGEEIVARIIREAEIIWEASLPSVEDRADDPRDEPWPQPLALVATIDAEAYPLDALPDIIRQAVDEVQGFTKAPFPMVASCALAALSLSAQSLIDVRRADKLTGPVGLFFLTIADSGERKSTCDGFFSSPIKEYDRQQEEKAKPERRRYLAALDAWNAERDGLLTAMKQAARKGASPDDLRRRLADLQERNQSR